MHLLTSIAEGHNLHIYFRPSYQDYMLTGLVNDKDIGYSTYPTLMQARDAAENLVPWVSFRKPDPANDQ